jgi:protein TonB
MSDAVIFKELPATFPERDKFKKPSIVSSLVFHGLMIVALLLVPMLVHESISEHELLISLVSPLPPPPGPPVSAPPKAEPAAPAAAPKRAVKPVEMPAPEALVMPTEIPKEIARIIEDPIEIPTGVVGGIPGGIPGGAMDSALSHLLSSSAAMVSAPPPPAPPPPPPPPVVAKASPVRVGGMIREPRLVKIVNPIYPKLAAKARVVGTVVLEATLSTDGSVEEIRVVSGHMLLVEAAIECVRQWKYEPTLLNGTPIPIILTAKVTFAYRPVS